MLPRVAPPSPVPEAPAVSATVVGLGADAVGEGADVEAGAGFLSPPQATAASVRAMRIGGSVRFSIEASVYRIRHEYSRRLGAVAVARPGASRFEKTTGDSVVGGLHPG